MLKYIDNQEMRQPVNTISVTYTVETVALQGSFISIFLSYNIYIERTVNNVNIHPLL